MSDLEIKVGDTGVPFAQLPQRAQFLCAQGTPWYKLGERSALNLDEKVPPLGSRSAAQFPGDTLVRPI